MTETYRGGGDRRLGRDGDGVVWQRGGMTGKKKWQDLSTAQKTMIVTLASVELALTATALVDLARRPAADVKGPKALWALGCFVQPVGPIAYLTMGRRNTP